MLRIIKTEMNKAIQNRGFYLAMLAGSIFCLWNVILNIQMVEQLIRPDNRVTSMILSNGVEWSMVNVVDTSVFYNWLGVVSMNANGVWFYFLFPLLAAIPYGGAIATERKNGYRNQLIVRISKKKELLGKYIAVFLTGGITVTLPVLMDFLLGAMIMPATFPVVTDAVATISENQFGSLLFFRCPPLFVVANMGLMFLWGGVLAGTALVIGQITRKRLTAILTPLGVCIFIDLLYECSVIVTEVEWSPIRLFHMATIRATSGFVIFGEIIGLFIVAVVLLFVRGMQDEGL